MDLRYVAKVMLRHWFVVLLTVAATVAAGYLALQRLQPDYLATSSVVLLSPSSTLDQDGEEVAVNPYTRFSSTERVTATALVNVALGQRFAGKMAERGATGVYTIEINPNAGGPIIDLSVTTDSPESALRELTVLRELLQVELAERQEDAGAPPRSWIQMDSLSSPVEATALSGDKSKVLLAVAALGGGAAVGLALMAESLSTWRQRRKTSSMPLRQTTAPGREPVEAQAGPVGEPVEAQAGPVGEPVEAQAGPVGEPVEAQAGPVGEPVEAQAGPVGEPVEASVPAVEGDLEIYDRLQSLPPPVGQAAEATDSERSATKDGLSGLDQPVERAAVSAKEPMQAEAPPDQVHVPQGEEQDPELENDGDEAEVAQSRFGR